MTAELVETSRLFARTVARIDPAWVEPLATHLLKRVYSEPYWSSSKGAAMAKEKLLLYGLTLVAERPVLLGRLGDRVIDEGGARNSGVTQHRPRAGQGRPACFLRSGPAHERTPGRSGTTRARLIPCPCLNYWFRRRTPKS